MLDLAQETKTNSQVEGISSSIPLSLSFSPSHSLLSFLSLFISFYLRFLIFSPFSQFFPSERTTSKLECFNFLTFWHFSYHTHPVSPSPSATPLPSKKTSRKERGREGEGSKGGEEREREGGKGGEEGGEEGGEDEEEEQRGEE
jgi:hypothetical protein